MNRRGFIIGAGFLFLAVTVLFIVGVHLLQMQFQSLSMSRSAAMDNLHYQRVDKVQSFWQVGRRVFESYGGRQPTGINQRFEDAIRGWDSALGKELRVDIDATAANATVDLKKGAYAEGEVETTGLKGTFNITCEACVLVAYECSVKGEGRAVLCAQR